MHREKSEVRVSCFPDCYRMAPTLTLQMAFILSSLQILLLFNKKNSRFQKHLDSVFQAPKYCKANKCKIRALEHLTCGDRTEYLQVYWCTARTSTAIGWAVSLLIGPNSAACFQCSYPSEISWVTPDLYSCNGKQSLTHHMESIWKEV